MSVQVENLEEKNTVKLTIEVSAEDLEKALQTAYNKQKKNISMPGFRKGKVPRNMIEKMYGPEVFYEDAANDLMQQTYPGAVEESGVDVVSRPEIDVVSIKKGEGMVYTAVVAVKPEVTLGQYKGIQVTKATVEVTDDEVTAEIDKEREKNARTINVERPIENGDTAVIDFEGSIDGVAFDGGKGENHPLEIGSHSFIPGFEEQLIGKTAGEDVDVNVTFPEDYQAEDLKGKAALFKVKIHEVKTKEIPELDEEYVQDVTEFDTVEDYKNDVRAKLQTKKENEVKNAQTAEAMSKAVEATQMDIPAQMIDMQCENMVNQFAQQMASQGLSMEQYLQFSGATIDQLKEQVRPEAETRIKNDLVLEAIAKAENIEITDADVDAEIEKMAAMYQMEADKLKGYMGEAQIADMKLDLASQRAMELVGDSADACLDPVVEEAPAEETTEE